MVFRLPHCLTKGSLKTLLAQPNLVSGCPNLLNSPSSKSNPQRNNPAMSFAIQITPQTIQISHANQYQVEIYPFGALLNRFAIRQENGQWHNVIAAYSSPQHAEQSITQLFRSAKLSPFVCRLDNAQYTHQGSLKTIRKFKLGDSAIHGLIFDAPFALQSSHSTATHASVTLAHVYRSNDSGYPFAYQIQITYTLETNGKLHIHSRVRNLSDSIIPIADGWHPYFAVDGDMANWQLFIRSQQQLAFNNCMLPTGETIASNPFAQSAPIAQTELDNCFVLTPDFAQPAVILQGERVQLSITPEASYPFVQAYTPPARDSIALENLSSAPDAFNNQIGLIQLAPQQTQEFVTVYQLEHC
jgi:hypothetical protein